MNSYQDFLIKKSQAGSMHGFDPVWMPDWLFDFQADLVTWAIQKGRAAILADCGLGKTPMEFVWSENVAQRTKKPVLILTPLAVSQQMLLEADKFGVDITRSKTGKSSRITVTNYESLHRFDPSQFGGVVCDESSILKNFDGRRKSEITQFMRKVPYRLLATATAAPNDYTELGTSSEALGYMGHMDMLNRFFSNNLNNSARGRMRGEVIKWRFKGHAESYFWRWVCSWARSIRKPSDLGYDDSDFILPPLNESELYVESSTLPDGFLFAVPAHTLEEQREERRRTIPDRCEKVAQLVNGTNEPALVWCHLNDEGDLLEKLIPDAVQVSGANSDDIKEERLIDFAKGNRRVLITKPKIGAWGLNFQHCAHITNFPSHSYEQYYQGIRRCWRFGQKRPVHVDIVTTEGERGILKNMQHKSAKANQMFSVLAAEMKNELSINHINQFNNEQVNPSWL